ncbi:MAG: VapE domain-containing protein [Cyclobacteriaceae bacterium]
MSEYEYPGELNPSDKDTMVYLSECLMINLDELASLNKNKESALKEVITKGNIKVRKAYRRDPESLVRRASFTGSVNDSQILTDATGSRRYLIHQVTKIDYQTHIDIDKVMAEAYAMYKSGTKYWFDGPEIDRINTHNNQFRQVTALEEILLRNFAPATSKNSKCEVYHWTATELLNQMMEQKLLPRVASASYLGKLLNRHGFTSVNHSGVHVYKIVKIKVAHNSSEELFN